MGIINSLNQIHQNGANFKKWEAEQDNIDHKRKELEKRNPPSKQELREAKERGDIIVDVTDIMDQHSENVAENVETATEGPVFLAPWLGLALGGTVTWKTLWKPALKESSEQKQKFLKENETKLDDLLSRIKAENPKDTRYVSKFHLLNKKRLENLKISDKLKIEAGALADELARINKKHSTKGWAGVAVVIGSFIGSFIWANVYATKLQIEASRIARFQTYGVLDDTDFINFTPEQREKLEKMKQNRESKTDKLQGGMFKSLANLKRSKEPYEVWKHSEESKPEKSDKSLTEEEFEKSQRDQEVIQRLVRKINNKAEVYSENMEVVGNVLIGGTPVLGMLVGWSVAKVLEATKVLQNAAKKMVYKYGDEDAQKAYEKMNEIAEDAPGRQKLFWKFKGAMKNSELEKDLEKEFKKEFKPSVYEAVLGWIKKNLPIMLSHAKGRKKLFGRVSAIVTGIFGALIGLKLQKVSARVGRYVAKKEEEQDSGNFIGRSEKDFKAVPDMSDKKEKPNKLKENIMFIPTVLKQYGEWKKHRKEGPKRIELTQKDLKELGVTDKQMNDAKNLKRKLFNTFEAVDDKSQEYSESVEAACDIAQPMVFWGGLAAAVSPIIIYGIQVFRGKITARSITNKIVSVLSGSTGIMNTKLFKNYLKDVAGMIPNVVRNQKTDDYVIKKLLEDVNIREIYKNRKDLTVEEMNKLLIKKLESLSDDEFDRIFEKIENMSFVQSNKFIANMISSVKKLNLSRKHLLWTYKGANIKMHITKQGRKALKFKPFTSKETKDFRKELNKLAEKIDKMSDEDVKQEMMKWAEILGSIGPLKGFDIGSMDKAYIQKMIPKVQKIIRNVPKDELKNIMNAAIDEFNQNPDQFMEFVQNGSFFNILMTKNVQTAVKAAQMGWLGLSMVTIYIIESWLADIQLKGGRLGVMKALESLEDPAYYANIDYKEREENEKSDKKLKPAA